MGRYTVPLRLESDGHRQKVLAAQDHDVGLVHHIPSVEHPSSLHRYNGSRESDNQLMQQQTHHVWTIVLQRGILQKHVGFRRYVYVELGGCLVRLVYNFVPIGVDNVEYGMEWVRSPCLSRSCRSNVTAPRTLGIRGNTASLGYTSILGATCFLLVGERLVIVRLAGMLLSTCPSFFRRRGI